MKVERVVNVDVTVEFEATTEDIVDMLAEDPDRVDMVMRAIGRNFYKFLKAVPQSVIEEMTPEARRMISEFLHEQSHRFVTFSPRGGGIIEKEGGGV